MRAAAANLDPLRTKMAAVAQSVEHILGKDEVIGFHENIQTRILEKDNHVTKMPYVNGTLHDNFYLAGNSICISGKEDSCPGTLYSGKMNNTKKQTKQ